MRFSGVFSLISRCRMCFKLYLVQPKCYKLKINNYTMITSRFLSKSSYHRTRISQDENGFEDIDLEESYFSITTYDGYARDLLFKHSKDLLLQRIYCCASVEELLNVVDRNLYFFKSDHITQTICVLYDLLKIFQDISSSNLKTSKQAECEFLQKLQEDIRFQKLATLLRNESTSFDHTLLSFSVLYLNKLGLPSDSDLIQHLLGVLKNKLLDDFSIASAARFLETAFSESSLRPYFVSQELIPEVFKKIDFCNSPEVLNNLSISLNKLYKLVTDETLELYKQKIKEMINNKSLSASDYKVILQVISLLNYPKWRDKNTVLISELILLIKNNLNQLNISEILLLYEVLLNPSSQKSLRNKFKLLCNRF